MEETQRDNTPTVRRDHLSLGLQRVKSLLRRYLPDSMRIAVLAAVYFATARLGLSLGAVNGVATAVWPPTGISLAALLLSGYRLWPGIACGALLANLSVGVPFLSALGIATGNTFEALLGAYLLRHVAGFRNSLARLRDVFSLVGLAAVLSTMVSATIGATSAWLGGLIPSMNYVPAWSTWWIGDGMGDLIVAPMLLTWRALPNLRRRPAWYVEVAILLTLLVVSCWLFFDLRARPVSWVVFPFLIWAALRLDQPGTTATVFVASGMAIWSRAQGADPVSGMALSRDLASLQIFMGAVSVTGMVLAAIMSEREQVHVALQASEARFRALFDGAPTGITITDARGYIVSVNRQIEKMFGYEPNELIGRSVDTLVPRRFRDQHVRDRASYELNPQTRAVGCGRDLIALRKDGTEFPVEIGLSPVRSADTALVAAHVTDISTRKETERMLRRARDDLERRVVKGTTELRISNYALRAEMADRDRAQNALRESEERFRLLVDNVRDYAIFMVDLEGRVASWTAAAAEITGYASSEILGKHFSCFYPTDEVERGAPDLAIRLAATTGRHESESWRLRKDGSRFWASTLMSPIRDANGNLQCFAKVMRDVTERKEADRRMSELSRRLLTLQEEERRRIGRELHDSTAQNLAATAMNLAVVLRAPTSLSDGARKALTECSELIAQCSREIRTISYLLHPPLLDEVGLVAAIRWYADGFAKRSGIHVAVDVPPDLGRLSREMETALFRIVQECLTNIHRHTRSTTARIEIVRAADTITLKIDDTGQGMAAEIVKALADADTGIGVGIMGMRERMRQLGGHLEIRSGDDGTAVEATLPVVEPRDPAR